MAAEQGVHVEVTTLVIPGKNDGAEAMAAEADEMSDSGLPAHPVIMARILSLPDFLSFSGLPEETDRTQAIHWLRQQRIYIAEAV